MRFLIGSAIARLALGIKFQNTFPYIRQQPGIVDYAICLEGGRNVIEITPTVDAVIEMEKRCGSKLRMLSNSFNTEDLIGHIIAFEEEINNHMRRVGMQVPDNGYIEYLHDGSRVGDLANCLNNREKVLMKCINDGYFINNNGFLKSWRDLELICRHFIIEDKDYAHTLVAFNAHVLGLSTFEEKIGPLLKLMISEMMRVSAVSSTHEKEAIDAKDIDKLNQLSQFSRHLVIEYFDGIAQHMGHVKGMHLVRDAAVASINDIFPDPPQPESENTDQYWAKMERDYQDKFTKENLENLRRRRVSDMRDVADKLDEIAMAALASKFDNLPV